MADGLTVIEWFTTRPNPRVVSHTADAGQRGWRLHAIEIADADRKLPMGEVTAHVYADGTRSRRGKASACGLRPEHGWGIDLFIIDRCTKCERILARKEKTDGK